jgi:AcrR family transcriptional regulator
MKDLTTKQREKRNSIIHAAAAVFKKYGFKKTSMADVAKASGKAKSSIYYYFASKEEIFKAVILSEARIYREIVLKAIATAETPHEKLKSYIMIRLQTDKILANFHKALNSTYLKQIKFVNKLKNIYDREEFSIFRDILRSGVNADYFKIYDLQYAAVGIVTAMRGIESTLLHNPEDPLMEEKVKNILNVVLYGIIKR